MKKLLLVLSLFMLTFTATARKFYFSSSTGSDSYTILQAQNPATPWATLKKLTSLTTSGTVCFQPGDTLAFKRGDVFYGNQNDTYCAAYWWNKDGYWTAPSGTPTNPIVFTNYGDPNLPLPNWLHPRAYYPVSYWPNTRESRGIIKFAGVHDIIIDGIQSNDFRVPEVDKQNPGYSGGWMIGEWSRGTSTQRNSYSDTNRRVNMVTRFVIKNCVFNNTSYGIMEFAGIDSKVTNCVFTNFKTTADTAGINDVGAAAFEAVNGIRCEFSYNYIKGAWAKSGRISSTNGLLGIGFDMFNLYNSRIVYNTIIDCNGAFEVGNLDSYDSTAGFQYDTIAFNKIVNCAQLGYFHGTGTFAGNNHHIAMWNNVVISNNKDRNTGWGFGGDIYGDGQGFRPGTLYPWWFCRDPYNTFNPPNYPISVTSNTTAGSNIVTVSSATGISIGSVAFANNDSILGKNYTTVFVTGISGNQLTLSVNCTQTKSTTNIKFYLPINDPAWSNPSNTAWNNYSGMRSFIQYTDNSPYGQWIDTMFDSRNNVHYSTVGLQALYDRPRYKRSSNLYYLIGSARYATALGGTLNYRGTGEQLLTTGKLFVDTTATYPENWDLRLETPVAGVPIQGITKDFVGNNVTNPPTIGLFSVVSTNTVPTVATSTPSSIGTTSAFLGGNVSSTGGTDVYRRGFMYSTAPIADTFSGTKIISSGTGVGSYGSTISGLSANTPYYVRAFALNSVGVAYGSNVLFNTIPQPCTFTYGEWSTCNGTTQTRSYTVSPEGCSGVPPTDSVLRSCIIPCTSFEYTPWTACSGNIQYRDYTASPIDCTGEPPADSLSRPCTSSNLVLTVVSVAKATCTNKSNGSITVAASGGIAPYYYSINSKTNYVLNQTTFTGIKARSTNTIRVRDARGVIISQSVYVGSISNSRCP